jgi:hypothetical protein
VAGDDPRDATLGVKAFLVGVASSGSLHHSERTPLWGLANRYIRYI